MRRSPAGDDRRSVQVELTPRGRRLVDQAVESHLANEERLLDGLSRRDRAALERLLRSALLALERPSA